ncbi:class I SAM-dependent methyltransferase [Salinimicrobium gaetbulicola]|uniref:Class I SAM-dependent methyltransferase n=1 Tax=Salinimicrobium gaetbulicola TaxID=999702 RepID=A0ABW3IJZ5_9FLAO
MTDNQEKNKNHYEKLYANYDIKNILYWINHLDEFLDSATTTETSWFALYQDNFREKLNGKKVLEMGCGNCINAAVMAALGAEVFANDIASSSGEIVTRLNENFDFKFPIVFVEGDFLRNDLPAASFDYVIGKAFLHHLTLPVERQFLKETVRLLKPDGEARFFEPAVNSQLLNELRWYVPVGKRPSKWNKKAFQKWKENDPHPERSFSSRHWEKVGREYFTEVHILPVGTVERFSKIMKWGKKREAFRKRALKVEAYFPVSLNRALARSQLLVYRKPI